MFGGGANNPYDDVVGQYFNFIYLSINSNNYTAKTTDENLTTENWELILNLCDKVSDDGDEGSLSLLFAA